MKLNKILISMAMIFIAIPVISAKDKVTILADSDDMTLAIRNALSTIKSDDVEIILEDKTYYCTPDYAFEKYCAITNHGNGLKRIIFPFTDKKTVTIKGNGAKLIMHGQVFPFLFENCKHVTVSDLTIDWDIPFTFLGEVIAVDENEGWRIIRPKTEGFSWKFENGKILFPNVDGFNYNYLGSTLPFDKEEKRVVDGAIDVMSRPDKIEMLPNGDFKIYEKIRYYPPVGSLLSSKGDRDNDRYAPAFDCKECSNILFDNITIHHALGMGFLFERSQDINILNSRIILPEGTDRVISTTADATHFCNCKGKILIDNCRFENMLDDGTNVHGTYLTVQEVLDRYSVVASLGHFEQLGFKFADKGDEVWFMISPSSERGFSAKVKKVRVLNEKYAIYTFDKPLPRGLNEGDTMENKTWNPDYTMRNCKISHHRARNLLLKTPGEILIENNEFTSMMSSIQTGGENIFWYESGAVKDLVIRNNKFIDCAYCGTRHAVLYIFPRMNQLYDQSLIYDRNIVFKNNEIVSRNPVIVYASKVENLVIENNNILFEEPNNMKNISNAAFNFINTNNVVIKNNKYEGHLPPTLFRIDEASSKTICIKDEGTVDIQKDKKN